MLRSLLILMDEDMFILFIFSSEFQCKTKIKPSKVGRALSKIERVVWWVRFIAADHQRSINAATSAQIAVVHTENQFLLLSVYRLARRRKAHVWKVLNEREKNFVRINTANVFCINWSSFVLFYAFIWAGLCYTDEGKKNNKRKILTNRLTNICGKSSNNTPKTKIHFPMRI